MKKIVSMILVVMMTMLCFATVGSAVTLTSDLVDAADQMYLASSEDSAEITVEAEATEDSIVVTYSSDVLAATTGTQATIIIFDAATVATPSAGNIIQIDQFDYDAAVSTYEYEYTVEEGQEIVVMMGGTGIENPGSATITTVVKGDITGEGDITMADAIQIARLTLADEITPAQIAAADVTGEGEVTMADAIQVAKMTIS